MRRTWRCSVRRGRPGLTLVELLVAIAFVGLTGALLLPRLAPVPGPDRATAAPEAGGDACLPAAEAVGVGWCPGRYTQPYVGIGAMLDRQLDADGCVRIDRPFPGDPAEQAGLESGDTILQVDGHAVQDETLDRVSSVIREGPIGSTVELTIGRDGYDRPLDVTVTRECIHPPAPFGAPEE